VALSDSIAAEALHSEPLSDAARTRAIFRDHFDFIWRLLRRLGVPRDEVDDAAQQVFIVAVNRLDAITNGSERSFLYGTAVRTASTVRRSAARRRKWVGSLLAEPRCSDPMPDEEAERREALAILDEALEELAPDLLRVFILSDIESLPVSEIALLERIPAGTAASRLRRARKAFIERVRELEMTTRREEP
jgi:RNA polymerase sigma-70 factor, ECF subfamily